MRREDLIGQFFEEISRMSTWTVLFHQRLSTVLGLHPTDLKCAGLLREEGPLSATELGTILGLTSGAVTGLIDRLEAAGVVKRIKDPHDRRKVIVELSPSPESIARMASYYEALGSETRELLTGYSDQELSLVLRFVRESRDLMRSQTLALEQSPGT